jgi:hypothetical protein
MTEFYIEVYFPPFPNKTKKFRVFKKYVRDCLSPDLIALFRVKAQDKEEALALTLMGEAFTMISPNAKQLKFA